MESAVFSEYAENGRWSEKDCKLGRFILINILYCSRRIKKKRSEYINNFQEIKI